MLSKSCVPTPACRYKGLKTKLEAAVTDGDVGPYLRSRGFFKVIINSDDKTRSLCTKKGYQITGNFYLEDSV